MRLPFYVVWPSVLSFNNLKVLKIHKTKAVKNICVQEKLAQRHRNPTTNSPRGPETQRPTYPEAQRRKDPLRPQDPETQRSTYPEAHGPSNQKAQRPKDPRRPIDPETQRSTYPRRGPWT